ncbi:MAG: 4-hydroxy-3-methylbut-2-enyl diphosphate reductase [Oscillospiraceae bacterium]|jgi:4-hydroxy-3-methylbut-2-enyl diphosphate reductase|nr:4-hydroxy-3-methylbut-2-enyl diphosphate reductase [Oscillospiraceae bacterium]
MVIDVIKLMPESGFCAGVKNAIYLAREQSTNILAGMTVYLYGDLVNNKHVMNSFLDQGFCVTSDIKGIPSGSIVLIRTHGVPQAVYEEFNAKNVSVIDCTCVRVIKIHEIVEEKSRDGYKIVVIGKEKHPEVIGTVGWCPAGAASVIEKEGDLSRVDLTGKVCVVAQTTCNVELWEKATRQILARNPSAEIYDTTCSVTKNRVEKAKGIAASCDAMFVIGDNGSSNSRELYKQCCTVCGNTAFITSLPDIERNSDILGLILRNNVIGLAGSASTPDEVIAEVYNYLVFVDLLKIARREIEEASREYFDDFRAGIPDNAFVQKSFASLFSRNEGGKHIRGTMIRLGEKVASHGTSNNSLPVAVAYELFQTSILIHDDIIDKSSTRRKKATIHIESANDIKKLHGSNISDETAEHFGASRALCIGDYGFFISYQFLAKCRVDSSDLAKIYQLYSKILAITCEGEIMDVILPYENISIPDNYEKYKSIVTQIYEYKTAWYTLAGPIMLGALCGNASNELIELLKEITIPLGIAFQIKDDLLGIYSSEEMLGKSVLSDIRENKQTLMYGFACKNANGQQRTLLDRHYGKAGASAEDLEIVRQLFEETGAKKYAEDEIRRLSNVSCNLISSTQIDDEYQSILCGLVSYLIGREQ